jgi:hypothetical protein
VNKTIPVPIVELLECTGPTIEMSRHQLLIGEVRQWRKIPQLLLIQQIQVGHWASFWSARDGKGKV